MLELLLFGQAKDWQNCHSLNSYLRTVSIVWQSNLLLSTALTPRVIIGVNYKAYHLSEPYPWEVLHYKNLTLIVHCHYTHVCPIFIREGTVCRDNIRYLEAMCSVRARKERSSPDLQISNFFFLIKKLSENYSYFQTYCFRKVWVTEKMETVRNPCHLFLGGKKTAQILYPHSLDLRILKEHVPSPSPLPLPPPESAGLTQ